MSKPALPTTPIFNNPEDSSDGDMEYEGFKMSVANDMNDVSFEENSDEQMSAISPKKGTHKKHSHTPKVKTAVPTEKISHREKMAFFKSYFSNDKIPKFQAEEDESLNERKYEVVISNHKIEHVELLKANDENDSKDTISTEEEGLPEFSSNEDFATNQATEIVQTHEEVDDEIPEFSSIVDEDVNQRTETVAPALDDDDDLFDFDPTPADDVNQRIHVIQTQQLVSDDTIEDFSPIVDNESNERVYSVPADTNDEFDFSPIVDNEVNKRTVVISDQVDEEDDFVMPSIFEGDSANRRHSIGGLSQISSPSQVQPPPIARSPIVPLSPARLPPQSDKQEEQITIIPRPEGEVPSLIRRTTCNKNIEPVCFNPNNSTLIEQLSRSENLVLVISQVVFILLLTTTI